LLFLRDLLKKRGFWFFFPGRCEKVPFFIWGKRGLFSLFPPPPKTAFSSFRWSVSGRFFPSPRPCFPFSLGGVAPCGRLFFFLSPSWWDTSARDPFFFSGSKQWHQPNAQKEFFFLTGFTFPLMTPPSPTRVITPPPPPFVP